MARFNQTVRRNPSRRNQPERRASLESRGHNVGAIMAENGIGERRAMAVAEMRSGLVWHNGAMGRDMGHYPAPAGRFRLTGKSGHA